MGPLDRARKLAHLDAAAEGVPWSQPVACHFLFDLALAFDRPQVLEVSCGYGKSTAYLAAAVRCGDGRLYTVDHERRAWQGRTAADLVEAVDAADWCDITFGIDARWYLLDLLTGRPGPWVDLAFVDASHAVEIDSFVALAAWTHLKPGGVLVFDDLDWTAEQHAQAASGRSRPATRHVRVIYDYVRRLPDVDQAIEWGGAEQEWPWGVVRKRRPDVPPGGGVAELIASLGGASDGRDG